MATFVNATDPQGRDVQIPAHWVDHPVLSKGFTVKKAEKDTARAAAAGSTTSDGNK